MTGQINAYFAWSAFNTPHNNPYLETYLTVVGSSLQLKRTTLPYQNSVNILLTIKKDSTIIKAKKYNLLSPFFYDTLKTPIFIDNQRYTLPNGTYDLEFVISDNNSVSAKPLTIKETIQINFINNQLQFSSVQLLESFKKTEQQNVLSKSGYDLVPYTINYYPETTKELCFYIECYNTEKNLGENKNFVFSYYIETAESQKKMNSFGSFKKQISTEVNILLAKMDINLLGTGNYNLVIELLDENNKSLVQKKVFFQRLNKNVDIAQIQLNSEKQSVANYFGSCNNTDTLRMFVECLWPIANGIDKDRIINQSLKKDNELMKKFVIDFWQRRAADTANPLNLWANYYKQVQQVMVLFKCGKQKGYYTDRGRVYLQYGPPSQRSQQPNEANTFPYEIWQYYRTTDASNGQFFSNKKFVFVNKMIGDDCYNIVHSDMRGENNNPQWQFEVTRRNNNGKGNPDNTTPVGTEFNQFNEIYSNPR